MISVRIRNAIVKRRALDRIMIGFNGVKRAKTSDREANPMLQDVNKGWLQKSAKMRRIMSWAAKPKKA
nr:phage major capsid protein, P2 family [Klebsiella pneumoniae]